MNPHWQDDLLRRALDEDLGLAGDLTSEAIFPDDHRTRARVVAREPMTVAGIALAGRTFELFDARAEVEQVVSDGDQVSAGSILAMVSGPTRAVLSTERTALNLLARLSGIATATAAAVAAVAGTGCRIADTRKTTPTLRALEKYAVRVGGGSNHRFGLYDAVMVKDNHVAAAGGVTPAVTAVRARVGHTVPVEVEVDTLDQLREVLAHDVDVVLLDNMSTGRLRTAVELVAAADHGPITEASGGIRFDDLRAVADAGVDVISLGALTHSSRAVDVALDLEPS